MPSSPPEMMRDESPVDAMAVTAFWCASLMVNSSLPDCGPKPRILPSPQPDRMVLPSCRPPEEGGHRAGGKGSRQLSAAACARVTCVSSVA